MPDPNNYLITEHKICFQMICKAGNTSMKCLLINMFEKDSSQKRSAGIFKTCSKNEIPDDYLVIGFCRHPEDRLISCWKDKVNGKYLHKGFIRRHPKKIFHKMPFEKFVEAVASIKDNPLLKCDQHFRSQTFDLNLDRIDYLIRMESFNSDWNNVREIIKNHCGADYPAMIDVKNKTQGPLPNIDEETRKRIERRFANDYKLLGYEKRSAVKDN